MGSAKYPGENAYSDHMASNGGGCNAYTNFEETNYQFTVKYSGLQMALDLTASNFRSPLFLKNGMEREIKAVESEYQMQMTDDDVRLLQILQQQTVRPDHILNRFMWGNIDSLEGKSKETLWEDLNTFYE